MPLFVGIYNVKNSQKNLVGTIILDNNTFKVKSYSKNKVMENIFREPIFDINSNKYFSPTSNPEEWMYILQYQYRSPYLWASSPSLNEPSPTFRESEEGVPDLVKPTNENSSSGEDSDEQENPPESPKNDSEAEEGGSTVPQPQNAPQPV